MLFYNKAPEQELAKQNKKTARQRGGLRMIIHLCFFIFAAFFVTAIPTKQAQARCCYCCIQPAQQAMHAALIAAVISAQNLEFTTLRDQLLSKVWWHSGVAPLAKRATREVVTNGWALVASFGAMLDSKLVNDRILDMQVLSAKTTKRHMPSVAMCKFASLNKSMAQADQRAKMVHDVLGEYSLRRVLGQAETIGAIESKDVASRLRTVLDNHCGPKEFGSEATALCPGGPGNPTDINFTDAIDVPDTINIGLDPEISGINTNDETASVMAMKTMLYNHKAPPRIGKRDLQNNYDGQQSRYLNWRGTVAKRTVAENSFDTVIGMKAASGVAVKNQYKLQLESLGMSAAESEAIAKTAPSYWAQMEHLTKKLYQNTNFFVNLYDGPDNVLRQSASMDAIALMQMRDYYNSLVRSEMALSILLDTEVGKEIDALNNTLNQWGN